MEDLEPVRSGGEPGIGELEAASSLKVIASSNDGVGEVRALRRVAILAVLGAVRCRFKLEGCRAPDCLLWNGLTMRCGRKKRATSIDEAGGRKEWTDG